MQAPNSGDPSPDASAASAPANPIHVVAVPATPSSKASQRAALRALHAGLAEAEANVKSLLRDNPLLRASGVPRLPRFAIRRPSFSITQEPFEPYAAPAPASAPALAPASPSPRPAPTGHGPAGAPGPGQPMPADAPAPATPALDLHSWNDLARDEPDLFEAGR
jgi:hypothetical protein